MLYISSHLTVLMLAIVPPISLGAVSIGFVLYISYVLIGPFFSGVLWPVLEEAI
jgi:hypothetical protein